MTTYATKGAVLDRFLADYEVDPDTVLSISFAKYASALADIRIHTADPVRGLDYICNEGHPRHRHAAVDREDLVLLFIHVASDEAVAR